MAGAGEGEEERARRRSMVEAEAEESGEEGAAGEEDEEDEDAADDGADLDGFIAPEEEGGGAAPAAEGGDGDESSSSDGEGAAEEQELLEEDLAVLQEAGIDLSQLERKKRGAEAEASPSGEPASAPAGSAPLDLAAPAAAAAAGGGLAAAVRAVAATDAELFGDFSDEDIDEFIVEEPGSKRRRKAEDADLGIDDEQLQEIIDIFGDASVLRPIDEASVEAPAAGAPEEAAPASQAQLVQLKQEPQRQGRDAGARVAMDPDLRAKLYESQQDLELERKDAPERWSLTYKSQPALLDRNGERVWSEDEVDCEARWIYQQAFSDRDRGDWEKREQSVKAIKEILDLLHVQQLEPIVVVTQFDWRYSALLYREDLWKICDLDQHHWDRVWLQFKRLRDWRERVKAKLPEHIAERAGHEVFDQLDAEISIRDACAWFCAVHPDQEDPAEARRRTPTSVSQRIAAARQQKFDEKLGVKESLDQMTLQAFSITPEELGKNILNNKQLHKPDKEKDENLKFKEVLEVHRNEVFQTAEAVQEAIILLLSRLIAAEPLVRDYVRGQFHEMCAISTYVTESGKSVARDAAQSFKRSYRAFHLVNRRVNSIGKDDELFLDVLDLQRKGFITLEYSLIKEDKNASNPEHAYKYVMLGHDDEDLARDKSRMAEHFNRTKQYGDRYTPGTQKGDMAKWTWCKEMQPRLEAIVRSHEIVHRRKTAEYVQSQKALAEALYAVCTMSFTENTLNPYMVQDPILERLVNMYCTIEAKSATEGFVVPGDWNGVRKTILLRVLRDELYPMLWAEVQAKLAKAAEDAVCRACAASLAQLVDVQPWVPKEEERSEIDVGMDIDDAQALKRYGEPEDDDMDPAWRIERARRRLGHSSALVVLPEMNRETCVVALVNAFGDPVDMRMLFTSFQRAILPNQTNIPVAGSHLDLKQKKVKEHREVFKRLLTECAPAAIFVPIVGVDAVTMRSNLQQIVEELHRETPFKAPPQVLLCDPSVSRLVAYHPRIKEEGVYRDCETPVQRIAISMVRFMQDPLAETCQLWHERPEENGLFRLRLHRLQHAVPKGRLGQALGVPLAEALVKAGVHVNKLRHSAHLTPVVALLPGFGPRKLRLFRKCLTDAVTSRRAFAERIAAALDDKRKPGEDAMSGSVAANCLPFIKISPDVRDSWDPDTTPGFDRTRLAEVHRPWVLAMCEAACRVHASANGAGAELPVARDPVVRVMRVLGKDNEQGGLREVVEQLKLENWDWEKSSGQLFPPHCNPDQYMQFLVEEILQPHADRRQPRTTLEDAVIFHLCVAESADNLNEGCLVHGVVEQDQEKPDPGRPAGGEAKIQVNVKVLPSMIRGSFRKQYAGSNAKGYISGCDRMFERGETVLCRLIHIQGGEDRPPRMVLSVDMDGDIFLKHFPIQDEDAKAFVPLPSENWVRTQLGLSGQSLVDELQKLKSWISRPRNVRHPNWVEIGHEKALEHLDVYPMGNVIFRPSKRHDVILGLLKVRATKGDADTMQDRMGPATMDHCYRIFDIVEVDGRTRPGAFELAPKLEVDGLIYKDLDEIIARHMEPIMDNLRALQQHRRFGLGERKITDKYEVKEAITRFSKQEPKLLHYSLLLNPSQVGHGLLLWALGGKLPREEVIEVHPRGFALWGKYFEKLGLLVQWFKSVGWRNATGLRQEFKDAWKKRKTQAEERRGKDALANRKKGAPGYRQTMTTTGGLQTPGGAGGLSTPGGYAAYGSEAAAPTPSGLTTPGGNRTPGGAFAAPGSPAPMHVFGGTSTPTGLSPGTPRPMGMQQAGQNRPLRQFAPMTPRGL